MTDTTVIHWFRNDLRISDNPAFAAACEMGTVLPVYIFDDASGDRPRGQASRWWLYQSLVDLDTSLKGSLNCFFGDAKTIILELVKKYGVRTLCFNRRYQAAQIARDDAITQAVQPKNCSVVTKNGALLWEPQEVLKADGTPYRVFTPFYQNGCHNAPEPRRPIAAPRRVRYHQRQSEPVTQFCSRILPTLPWFKKFDAQWSVSEQAAHRRLDQFLSNGIKHYKTGRDFFAQDSVSRLSPYIHHGQISVHHIYYKTKELNANENTRHFLSELGWREFSYYLLYHFKKLSNENMIKKFDAFPWRTSKKDLAAWQKGRTGFPIIDAAMRELWETGYMHNRARMIVASFLVKNLMIHWRHGEAWFWDCLLDADHANNCVGWQWAAGTGVDAAPYFRIFNPVTQARKFDPDGTYIKRFVPELLRLETKYIFEPWKAPRSLLHDAGIELGTNYPEPMVDLSITRQNALDAFQSIRGS